MIVYRFEKNGIGPYVNGLGLPIGSFFRVEPKTMTQKKCLKAFENMSNSMDAKKRADVWSKAHNDKQYLYGCSSKNQLRAYFGGNFKILFKNGFRIKRYKVPDSEVLEMGVEVAFPIRYHKLQTIRALNKRSPI